MRGGPSYEYTTGPDNKRYATGGEVNIDTSKAENPEATVRKAQVIYRAAMAPAEPSSQDRSVASEAKQMEAEARQEIAEQRRESAPAGSEGSGAAEGGSSEETGEAGAEAAANGENATGAAGTSTHTATALDGTHASEPTSAGELLDLIA